LKYTDVIKVFDKFQIAFYHFTTLSEHYANSRGCGLWGYKQDYVGNFIIIYHLISLMVQSPLNEAPQLDTPHSVGLPRTSDRPFAETSTCTPDNATLVTVIRATGRIRTRNPSKWAAADPRLRLRGHWNRQTL
jgi:hypothetical protein